MSETCGAVNPVHSFLVCDKPPDPHANHAAGSWAWDNPEVQQQIARQRAAASTPAPATKRDRERAVREMVIEHGSRFVRGEDPVESHEAIERYEPKRTTAKGRVLFYLREHLGEWVDAPVLTLPEIGGFAGTRRLRELREDGWPIQTRTKPEDINTWQHRLVD